MRVSTLVCLASVIGLGCRAAGVGQAAFLDLSRVQVAATHDNEGRNPGAVIIDGDEATVWTSGPHDHTAMPANLFLSFPEPTAVGALEVLTDDAKGDLRLTHLEVYAAAGDGWALVGAVRGNDQVRFTVTLTPAQVQRLRLRVRDTARPDHAWPRIHEIRLLPPEDGTLLTTLAPSQVPDETPAEALFVAKALGIAVQLPDTQYDPNRGYLWYARTFADTMIEKGTDRYGPVTSPMFVSILDCRTHEHPNCELPTIEGQRQGDRALFGGNLQHDLPLLVALEDLTRLTGDEKYREAARDYLRFFLDNCTGTPTGLWPWGEHAHWDFYREQPGHTTHEHLGLPPLRFWETAWAMKPEAVLGEASGCINHIVNLQTFDFNRHADITQPLPDPRPAGLTFLDFPRHGAFYLYLWAFAYSKTAEPRYLQWITAMMDHFQANIHPQSGLMRMATEDRDQATARLTTAVSAGLTMLEAAPLLGDGAEGQRCAQMGRGMILAVANLPHELDKARIVSSAAWQGAGVTEKLRWETPAFQANYGDLFLATDARMWLRAWQLTGEQRCLDIAQAIGKYYAQAPALPEGANTRAQVFGTLINLMLDLHEAEGGTQWLPAAERYAQQAIAKLYHNGLFRGATGLWYYESELWVSSLVQALVRLSSFVDDSDVTVEALHFTR